MKQSKKSLVDEFDRREADITELVIDQKADYFGSDCRKILEKRMARLDDSVDMKFNPTRSRSRNSNDFKSRICMPLVREKFKAFTGMTLAAFRNDPPVTVLPDGDTPAINAMVAQQVVDQNFRRTEFKMTTWREIVAYLGRYGCAVAPMRYRKSNYSQSYEKTTLGPFGFEVKAQDAASPRRHNVWNYTCNPLNYFQNKGIADPGKSDYQGYIERVPLSVLINDYENDPFVIKKNLREIINRAMSEAISDHRYFQKGKQTDWYRVGVDVTYRWGKIYITGHEGDERCYYLEMVGDKIIKFMTNPNDEDLVPISVYSADPRLEYWWGNTPVENSMPMENFLNMILGLRADQALQVVERFLFFDGNAGIDVADLNNRKHNGGYVRFNGKAGMRASDVVYEYQPRDFSANSIEPIIREIKEADQRVSFENDFQRQPAQGGPQNETATAALMMDAKGNVLKSEILESVSHGLVRTTRGNIIILQRQLPDYFQLTPANAQPMTVYKEHILGTYEFKLQTALTKNQATQMQNLLNFLTQMANVRNVAPDLATMQLLPVAQELTRKYDLDIDLNSIFPPQMQQAPALPGASTGMSIGPMPAPQQSGMTLAAQPQMMEMANAA
jgi:hypothetical protein